MNATDVARAMGELLDIEDISEEENFFTVGGNSLLALDLISQVRSRSGVDVSLLDFFRHPTPKDLAELVSQRGQVSQDNC